MGPSDHCSIQDNCIDNIFFFGGKRFGGSNPSLQVDYLKLSSTSQKGNYVVLKYSAQLILLFELNNLIQLSYLSVTCC